MKKTITKLAIALSIVISFNTNAQTVTFDTFTLSPNTYYQDNASTDFSNNGVTFQYGWNSSFGGYWESGSAYTNVNDTVNGSFSNLYGCIPGTAFLGNNYATVQSGAVISFSNNTTAVNGFYITNTTYAWKTIKSGNQFSRRFGDTTGTGSGNTIAQGEYPDWFKVLVKGYRGGSMLTDSIEFYLADYSAPGTANDYVIKNWQYVNCSSLGQVDSITFKMKSSDNSFGFMNTPSFFSMDNFVIQSTVGIQELSSVHNINLFPNPTTANLALSFDANNANELITTVTDISGKEMISQYHSINTGTNSIKINTENLEAGIYFIELKNKNESKKMKFIKL